MLHFVENADFITIHAGLLPLAQNAQKGDCNVTKNIL